MDDLFIRHWTVNMYNFFHWAVDMNDFLNRVWTIDDFLLNNRSVNVDNLFDRIWAVDDLFLNNWTIDMNDLLNLFNNRNLLNRKKRTLDWLELIKFKIIIPLLQPFSLDTLDDQRERSSQQDMDDQRFSLG